MYNNFEISLVVFMPNVTTSHASKNIGSTVRNFGSEEKHWIRSTNFKSIAGSKGKTMDLGKTVLPENEIYGSWIKTLDPKQKSLFHCTFFTFLKNGTCVPP